MVVHRLRVDNTVPMALFERSTPDGDVSLYYEEYGEGFPVLLIAPGGMRSEVSFWSGTPWDPIEQLAGDYRVIAMDQRNAGRSTGPIKASHGWQTFTDDQLALLDHLGANRFHVVGMCIGGPYIAGLIETAPDRVASGVMFQPIGRHENRDAFYEMFDSWARELGPVRSDVTDEQWSSFRENMYGGDAFMFNVDRAFISACEVPLMVLRGNDLYHPEPTSLEIADLAPDCTFVADWKDPADQPAARAAVESFLAEHT